MDKRTILIAEDNQLLLEIQRSLLERESFNLHTALTGKEALEKARHLKPHLVPLTEIMPDIAGKEVCAAIRSDPGLKETKVIIAVSSSGKRTLAEYVDAGFDEIVTKPFVREKLLESVQKLLGETFRRKPRYKVEIPCAVFRDRQGIPALMVDISEIGCCLEMDDPPADGIEVEVSFDLPDTVQSVSWKGMVRWSVKMRPGSDFSGIGVEFTGPPIEDLEILRDILDSMPEERRL